MLTLRCFGEVAASDARGAKIPLRSRKHTGLLLYLVAHPRTVHMRGRLAHLLWDGRDRKARHSLSQALYDIRSSMGPVIMVDANTVRLVPRRVMYELDAFEQAFQTRDHETVIDLYRGEFAPDLLNLGADEFERWLDGERERCRVLIAMALKNAQQAAEERGDWDQTCLAAIRLVRQNEFDEQAHCTLMRALCMKGDYASALAYYRTLQKHGWVTNAVKLMEMATWVRNQLDSAPLVVRERQEPQTSGRGREFRQLSVALRSSGPLPVRLVMAGERGLGREGVVRSFARLVYSDGGVVQWLPSDRAGERESLATELGRHPQETRLIVIRAGVRDWAEVMRSCGSRISRAPWWWASRTRRRLVRLKPRVWWTSWSPSIRSRPTSVRRHFRQRRGAAVLGRPPRVPDSPAATGSGSGDRQGVDPPQVQPRGNQRPGIGARLAYERSAEVRSLVDGQLETLSVQEGRLAATLGLLTRAARTHAELIVDSNRAGMLSKGSEPRGGYAPRPTTGR